MDKKKAIILGGVGAVSALGIGILLSRVIKNGEGPTTCAAGYHWDATLKACVADVGGTDMESGCFIGHTPTATPTPGGISLGECSAKIVIVDQTPCLEVSAEVLGATDKKVSIHVALGQTMTDTAYGKPYSLCTQIIPGAGIRCAGGGFYYDAIKSNLSGGGFYYKKSNLYGNSLCDAMKFGDKVFVPNRMLQAQGGAAFQEGYGTWAWAELLPIVGYFRYAWQASFSADGSFFGEGAGIKIANPVVKQLPLLAPNSIGSLGADVPSGSMEVIVVLSEETEKSPIIATRFFWDHTIRDYKALPSVDVPKQTEQGWNGGVSEKYVKDPVTGKTVLVPSTWDLEGYYLPLDVPKYWWLEFGNGRDRYDYFIGGNVVSSDPGFGSHLTAGDPISIKATLPYRGSGAFKTKMLIGKVDSSEEFMGEEREWELPVVGDGTQFTDTTITHEAVLADMDIPTVSTMGTLYGPIFGISLIIQHSGLDFVLPVLRSLMGNGPVPDITMPDWEKEANGWPYTKTGGPIEGWAPQWCGCKPDGRNYYTPPGLVYYWS